MRDADKDLGLAGDCHGPHDHLMGQPGEGGRARVLTLAAPLQGWCWATHGVPPLLYWIRAVWLGEDPSDLAFFRPNLALCC